ncbi:MAG: porin [Pirellulaceae bacterium]
MSLVIVTSAWTQVETAQGQAPVVPSQQQSLLERLESAEEKIRDLQSDREEGDSQPEWTSGYDDGFYIRPTNEEQNPFELRVNGRMQFRHTGFSRNVTHWTDSAGVVRPVRNRNDFEIERGRLEFSGFFLDPKLQFYINIDADTDDGHSAIFHDFWVNYEFSEAFNLHFGKAFVPGSREWFDGSTRTRFSDRSMGTTFFRPDRSVGIWATGEPLENLFYRAMVGDGFRTNDLTHDEIDSQFVYSGSIWKVVGDYGEGYSDLEWHCDPAARFGQSFTFAGNDRLVPGRLPLAEGTLVRLSDGTRLTEHGALAPGVTVDQFDIQLYALDAALKWRGFSLNGEYYFRWLKSIQGDGPLPVDQIFDHGYYAEMGYFVVPQRIELNSRISEVFGQFGNAYEYAGGVNWFINGTHNCKMSFDVTRLVRNPANNSGPSLRVGDDGLLFRTQLQVAF